MSEKISRWYQKEAVQHLMLAVQDPKCHTVAAIPTGGGKTLICCEFIDAYCTIKPKARILILSHVKEILEQNYDELVDYYGDFMVGIYSAGLGSKEIRRITVAGIQSIYNTDFTNWDLVIIDECHLITINQTGMYRKFLARIDANFVGLTATPFRLGHGYLHRGDGALFNDLCYDLTSMTNFNRLVEEGYLTRLISKGTILRLSSDGLHKRGGDFIPKELSDRFDNQDTNEAAVDEIIEYGANYKKWLIFAIDIAHAEHITELLNERGIPTLCVHSKMEGSRDDAVFEFKRSNKFRAMVNVNILTTGFDVPSIDLIAMLRHTESPVLHVQAIGRGLRIADGKDHCLVLDFVGNTKRLGPINDVLVKQKRVGEPGSGDAPVKECPACMALVHPKLKFCDVCGHEFVFKIKVEASAGTEEIVRTNQVEWWDVDSVRYNIHRKFGKPDSLKVTYMVGVKQVCEWICLEHGGYPAHNAHNWIRFRWSGKMPKTTQQLYEMSDQLYATNRLKADLSERFPAIKDVELSNGPKNEQLQLFKNKSGKLPPSFKGQWGAG